jgi:hypothetical protein
VKNKIRISRARLSKKVKKNLKQNGRDNPRQLVETVCHDLDTGKSKKILLDLENMRKWEEYLMGW